MLSRFLECVDRKTDGHSLSLDVVALHEIKSSKDATDVA